MRSSIAPLALLLVVSACSKKAEEEQSKEYECDDDTQCKEGEECIAHACAPQAPHESEKGKAMGWCFDRNDPDPNYEKHYCRATRAECARFRGQWVDEINAAPDKFTAKPGPCYRAPTWCFSIRGHETDPSLSHCYPSIEYCYEMRELWARTSTEKGKFTDCENRAVPGAPE